MTDRLKKISASDWQNQFETRAFAARDWVVYAAKKMPLEYRREVVQHIKEGMEEATFHKDISYGASEIYHNLIHDFWGLLKNNPKRAKKAKQTIGDFAMWAATQSPAHQSDIQNTLWNIVPEDIPEQERKKREMFLQKLGQGSPCCY